jgi:Calcineurin-like phosphoesterase
MDRTNGRPRQPTAALAKKSPPRIVEFEPIPERFKSLRPPPYRMDLSEIVSADAMRTISDHGVMFLHCIGDTGGVKRPEVQMLVAQGMEREEAIGKASFCYHVGDVVYYTGEIPDYWDQFYEPYEHYPLPIVAIPGNHDGELMTRHSTTLSGFHENFIAPPGTYTHESHESGRMAMSQPNFYWTLTTPYATIVGLYTNVPEHGRIDETQRAWPQRDEKRREGQSVDRRATSPGLFVRRLPQRFLHHGEGVAGRDQRFAPRAEHGADRSCSQLSAHRVRRRRN